MAQPTTQGQDRLPRSPLIWFFKLQVLLLLLGLVIVGLAIIVYF